MANQEAFDSLSKFESGSSAQTEVKAKPRHRELAPGLAGIAEDVEDTDAAGFTDATLIIDEKTNKRLRSMIYRRILPLMVLAYLMQALDKSTTVTGIQKDTHMKGQDYALTSTFLWVGIIAGFAESLLGPCLLHLSVMWFTKSESAAVLALYQSMLGFSNIILGIVGWGYYHISDSALHSWQWLFITIALLSILSGEDKVLFVERVRSNDQGIKNSKWKNDQAIEALTDPFIWLLFLLMMFYTLIFGGIGTFSGLLITKAFDFTTLDAQLLGMPSGAVAVLFYFITGWAAKKTDQTLWVMLGTVVPNVAGTIVLRTVAGSNSTRGGLLFSFYLMQALGANNPLIFGMLSRATATKKTVAYAIVFVAWAGGNAAAPQIFQAKWAPRYLESLDIHFGLYGAFVLTIFATRVLLVHRNKAKVAAQLGVAGEVNEHLHAFSDLTDLKNPDFRYSL
ncbi:hypothetical protein RQP46_001256 [Phenoliferia psychrophenolica]